MLRRQASATVRAEPDDLFARLDDQARLARHMSRPSLMMGGGRMTYAFDKDAGRTVGSRIRMGGTAFGLSLDVEEVVTEREPPRRKSWRTVGAPRLIVIGAYEMGFEIAPQPGGSQLLVWIAYERPRRGLGRWAPWLGDLYARWCVDRMVADARAGFDRPGADLRTQRG